MSYAKKSGFVSLTMGAIAGLTAFGASVPADAQEQISLTYISGFPPPTTFVAAFTNEYVKAVDEALAKTGNYKINWNLAHSGQIVRPRGEFEGLSSGLGDVADIPTSLHGARSPLYKLPYVTPFTTNDINVLVQAFGKLERSFSDFDAMWESFDHVRLATTANVDNYVLISDQPITKLSDLQGKKVGAAGPNLPWVTPTGAAGVQTNLADAYNSLNTGIYNAMIAWPQALGAFKLCEPAPNMLNAGFGANSMITLNFNQDTWNDLPADVASVLADQAEVWNRAQIRNTLEGAEQGLARCRSEYGLAAKEMPGPEIEKWAMALPNLAREWAQEMEEEHGFPGEEILATYMETMRKAGQPVVRDWDRE